MRDIKFRAMLSNDVDIDGPWIIGSIDPRHNEIRLSEFFGLLEKGYLRIDTLGQYTGTHDLTKKPIYEGAKIQYKEPWEKEPYGPIDTVSWDNSGCWCIYGHNLGLIMVIRED